MYIFLNFLYLFLCFYFSQVNFVCVIFSQATVDELLFLVCKEIGGNAAFLLHSLCCNTVSKMKRCNFYPKMKYLCDKSFKLQR